MCSTAWRMNQKFAGVVILFLLALVPAHAQITTQFSLDFDVSFIIGNDVNHYTGTGALNPFGNATLTGTESFSPSPGPVNLTFTLSNGNTFNATSTGVSGGVTGCTLASNITGGTGIFANATGSFVVGFVCSSQTSPTGSIHVSGTGSITTTNAGTVSIAPGALSFSFLQDGSAPPSQPIFLSNQTLSASDFTAVTDGQDWLSVSPAQGNVAAFSIATLNVAVDTGKVLPGTFAGTIAVTSQDQTFTVAVTLTVSSSPKELVLSKSALLFEAAVGSGPPPAQHIVVLNQGTGALAWTASASSLGGDWLSVSPSGGAAGDSPAVSVDPAKLTKPGVYYGIVQFAADGTANSPQSVVVVFNLLASDSVVISVQPTGLIFVAAEGTDTPSTQIVTVVNSAPQSATISAVVTAQQQGVFFVDTPSGSPSSGEPAQFQVEASPGGLKAGVYTGTLELTYPDGYTQDVALLLIVTPAIPSAQPRVSSRAAASTCLPTKLLPVSTALSQNFFATAAWPTALDVTVVDDCGVSMGPGDVTASFSSGDPPLAMVALGTGKWSGTWQPRYTAADAPVVITVAAESAQPPITGRALLQGTLQTNTTTPAVYSKGVVSTASFVPNAPLAPGGFASIFGKYLASSTMLADALPLSTDLGGAQVIVGGRLLPVQYASDGQLNVLLPYDLPPNSKQQLIVQQGQAYSTPETITIAPAQPAVFTQDQSGHGPGAITVVKPDGTQFAADPSHPASTGDALVIYCAGLGTVKSDVPAGSASPGSPAAKIASEITVTIGGQAAPVAFAGLTPGFAGLYQVNVTVPAGITPGPSVSVVMKIGALSSPAVTIGIQ